MKKQFLVICILCVVSFKAQQNLDLGFLPKVVISTKVNENMKWVNSIENRNILYDDEYQLTYNLVDVSSILSFKTNVNQSFNLGYIFRLRDGDVIHRIFQHYNFVNTYQTIKVGHRFAFEQFFQVGEKIDYRIRYRVSLEKPLNGERVDANEFYLKLGNEYLYDFLSPEIRFTPYLGYKVSDNDKIEFGVDYRLSDFTENETQNDFWLRLTWYYSFK